MRQRLMLVDPDAAFRLRLIAALSADWDVSVPAAGDDVLRLARAGRPELLLLAAGGRARPEALRLARVVKTDVRSIPHVGLYCRAGEAPPSRAAVDTAGVDGFASAVMEAGDLAAFAAALGRGEAPFPATWPAATPGGLRRLLNRVIGR